MLLRRNIIYWSLHTLETSNEGLGEMFCLVFTTVSLQHYNNGNGSFAISRWVIYTHAHIAIYLCSPGIEFAPLHCKVVFTIGPPGKSLAFVFNANPFSPWRFSILIMYENPGILVSHYIFVMFSPYSQIGYFSCLSLDPNIAKSLKGIL